MSSLLLGMVLSVCVCWFHTLITYFDCVWYMAILMFIVCFYPCFLAYVAV
jgi:hypothetical protein